MISFVSPCQTLGFIPMLKNASSSMSEWFVDAGWTREKNINTNIVNFFVMRHPRNRLLSGITQCIDWTFENTDITPSTVEKMMQASQIIVDPHSKSVCEYLYGHAFNPNKLWGFSLDQNHHTHTLINLLLQHYGVDTIDKPFPKLNSREDWKSKEVIELAKKIMSTQHFHFFLGYNMDWKLYNFITTHTKYYRLESNYINQKQNYTPHFENMFETNQWLDFLQQEILPFIKKLDNGYFSLP